MLKPITIDECQEIAARSGYDAVIVLVADITSDAPSVGATSYGKSAEAKVMAAQTADSFLEACGKRPDYPPQATDINFRREFPVIDLVLAERKRQVSDLGFGHACDDRYVRVSSP